MSFLNGLPLDILIFLGVLILGIYDCLKSLLRYSTKIRMFSKYRNVLVEFHNNVDEGKGIDPELSNYLLENSLKIHLDSVVKITTHDPIRNVLTGFVHDINTIVMCECHDFTGTCQKHVNMLTQNVGFLKGEVKKSLLRIFNPIYLVKNGVIIIFNAIPIVNLTPAKIKNFVGKLWAFILIVNTVLSLYLKKSLFLSIIGQISVWISQI